MLFLSNRPPDKEDGGDAAKIRLAGNDIIPLCIQKAHACSVMFVDSESRMRKT